MRPSPATVMERFGVEEAVIGDLLEKRTAGVSAAWFWWQVCGAILVTTAASVWQHKLLALRALVIGGSVLWVMRTATVGTLIRWDGVFGVAVGNYLLEADHEILRGIFLRYHLYDLPRVVWSCLGFALTGWIVGQTHREQRAAMVSLVAVGLALHYGYGLAQLVFRLVSLPRGVGYPYTLPVLIWLSLIPCVLVGGLWTPDARRTSRVQS